MTTNSNHTSRLIGAHVSASGGIDKAPFRVSKIGGNTLQLFSGSPRVWKRGSLDDIDQDKLYSKMNENNVESIFTHALYLVNLASDKPALRDKSRKALKHDLAFDAAIRGSGVVVHLGSHQGRGWEADREQVVAEIVDIISDSPTDSTFLIENSAGQKGKLCTNLEHIRWLFDQLDEKLGADESQKRVGWCFDTCHAHCGGYALGSIMAQNGSALAEEQRNPFRGLATDEIERLQLWDRLKVIHVNDSRDDFASGKDRHQNLGDGTIPNDDMAEFLNHDRLTSIPLILEVPGLDGKGPDKENVDRLKKIVS